MVDGIVLAGGFSSRAKTNKMFLLYKNKEIILHAINTMNTVCQKIILVTGHYHKELDSFFDNYENIQIVFNEDYEKGMFSSIKKGVSKTENSFFIIPGDYPLVQDKTYREILNNTGKIRVPSYNMRLGHPIYFDQSFKEKILQSNISNLKDFRNQYDFSIINVDDPGILRDIDDLESYNNLIREDD